MLKEENMYDPIGAYRARSGCTKQLETWGHLEFGELLEQDPLAYVVPAVNCWIAEQGRSWIHHYHNRYQLAKFLKVLFEMKCSSRCLDDEADRTAVANLITTKLTSGEITEWVVQATGCPGNPPADITKPEG